MFPHIPLTAVRYELERTGNVEATVERCLRDGRLPDVSPRGLGEEEAGSGEGATGALTKVSALVITNCSLQRASL